MPDLSEWFTSGSTTLPMIVWPLILGVIIAAVAVFLNKKLIGRFVARLLAEKASTPQSAKTFAELGIKSSSFLRFSLRREGTLRKMVKAVDTVEEREGKSPVATERYYIPEEMAYRAERLYDPDDASVMTVLLAVLIFILVAVGLLFVVPELIQMLKNAFSK